MPWERSPGLSQLRSDQEDDGTNTEGGSQATGIEGASSRPVRRIVLLE